MSDDVATPAAPRGRPAGVLPVALVVGGLALAALVAWPLGGWRTVAPASAETPEIAPGATFDGGRFSVTLGDALLVDRSPAPYDEPEPGESYLILSLTVENPGDEPVSALGDRSYPVVIVDGLPVLDGEGEDRAEAFLARDASRSPQLNPGMRDEVLLVWSVRSTDWADGDELRVTLPDGDPVEATLYRGIRWEDVGPGATATLVVRDERTVGG